MERPRWAPSKGARRGSVICGGHTAPELGSVASPPHRTPSLSALPLPPDPVAVMSLGPQGRAAAAGGTVGTSTCACVGGVRCSVLVLVKRPVCSGHVLGGQRRSWHRPQGSFQAASRHRGPSRHGGPSHRTPCLQCTQPRAGLGQEHGHSAKSPGEGGDLSSHIDCPVDRAQRPGGRLT